MIALGMAIGVGVGPAQAWSQPCEYVQVQTIWVQQCSPIIFNTSSCWQYTYSSGNTGLYAKVIICYPTS